MGQGWEEYRQAGRMRDAIERIVLRVLDRERPRYRYGTVSSIDRVNSTCQVYFDQDSDHPVPVKMGSIQPSVVGQIVRIAGVAGDRYVDDVIGAAYSTGGGGAGVSSFNTRTGEVALIKADVTGTGLSAQDVGAQPTGTSLVIVTAGTNLSTARPSGASAVYWKFSSGVNVGASGENVVNAQPGDLIFVAS